jgi:O-6-methylguanine DNA methyltransferase
MRLTSDRLSTPIGTLLLVSDDDGRVRALDFGDDEARTLRLLRTHYGDTTLAPGRAPAPPRCALEAYFVGDLGAIDDVPVATGGTPFQRTVWAALRRIPAGTSGALAAIVGRPAAIRAVGLAVGSNPVAVIVPCHRVIGADHSLTGYGGGLPRKRWLLEHEGLELGGGRVRRGRAGRSITCGRHSCRQETDDVAPRLQTSSRQRGDRAHVTIIRRRSRV